MSYPKHTIRNNRTRTTVTVALIVCVCVMSDLRPAQAQWGDFLRPESQLRKNTTTSTDSTPTTTPTTPAQLVAPSSQNHIIDEWYRFETAAFESLLTPREQHYVDRLIELGLTGLADFYCRKQIASDSATPAQNAGYTRVLLQTKKQELHNASPPNRLHVWEQIEQFCSESDARFFGTPYAPAVLLQRVNVQLAYAAMLIDDAMVTAVTANGVSPQVAERMNKTLALIDTELERISQYIASQPASPTTSRETVTQMTLAQLFRHRKAVALRLLAHCHPEQKSALISQSLAILRTLSDPRQGKLSTFAMFEAIACFRMMQQYDEAASLAERLRNNDFLTPHQRTQWTAIDLLLAIDRRDENRVHTALRAVEVVLQQQPAAVDMPELLLAQLQAYLFFWKRNIETQSSLPQIVGTTTAPNIDTCRRKVLEVTQRLEHGFAPYWHQRAEQIMLAESRFFGNDPVFVEQRADAFAREGRIDEAVERYDRLAAATSATHPEESFRIAKKAADLLAVNLPTADTEARHREQDVIDRYRNLAVTHPKSLDAIDAHLAAVYYAARRLQAGDESGLEDYLSLLREHFLTWPHAKQAEPLRLQTAQLLIHESKYRDAITTLTPLTNRSPIALDAIQAADACFDVLRFARPDTKATLENEAASWFYRRLLNTDGAVVADWNDADAQCLLYMVKYGLLYANIIEHNRASNPNANIAMHYQLLERMLRIGLANYQQATPEWRATVDLMLLYVLAAQGRMNDAAQILQTMQQWSMAALMAALDRLQQLADISPATNRHVLGEMRLNIVQMIEQPLETPQQNAGAPINHHRLDVIRADALADTGRSQEAVDLLGQRLRQSPDDMELLVSLARILERQPDVQSQELSLKLWRSIEQRSWKHSETWWNAREATLRLLIVTGQRQEAESTFQMLQILNPELGGADRKLRLESLFPPEP